MTSRKNTVADVARNNLYSCLLAHHHLNLSHRIVAVMIDIMAYASFGASIYAS
jgi:hypothetical protein